MPDIHKIDPINDKRIRDCHNIYYHTIVNLQYELTNIRNKGLNIITIADRSLDLYEVNKKTKKCSTKAIYIQWNGKINHKNL